MRVLVNGSGTAAHPRLAAAAAGLALRGHEVFWLGAGGAEARAAAPDVIEVREAGRAAPADLVVGAGSPLALAHRGWFAGARGLVSAVDAQAPPRWSLLDRWAWTSMASFALVEPAEADSLRRQPGPLALERVGLWSDERAAVRVSAGHPDCEILERACERLRARQRGAAARPAAFLDRDGTLIHEIGYLSNPADVRLLPGVGGALARLRAAGYALVVISNQAGVGRGYFGVDQVHAAMAELRRQLRAAGVELDGIYFCPHAPDAGCACRKPGIELLERAAEDLGLGLAGSVMIGDKRLDVEAGARAGCRTVLLGTGYGGAEPGNGSDEVVATHRAPDLAAAAEWVLSEGASVSG